MHRCRMQHLMASHVQVAAWRQHLWGLTACACPVWACAAVRCRAGGMAAREGQPVCTAV